jgi:hypothetical protein
MVTAVLAAVVLEVKVKISRHLLTIAARMVVPE